MPLTMRPTGLASGVYADRQDWTIFDDGGEPVGRLYEDGSASTPAELRWFWSIVVYVHPAAGIVTSGKAPTLGGQGAVRDGVAALPRLGRACAEIARAALAIFEGGEIRRSCVELRESAKSRHEGEPAAFHMAVTVHQSESRRRGKRRRL